MMSRKTDELMMSSDWGSGYAMIQESEGFFEFVLNAELKLSFIRSENYRSAAQRPKFLAFFRKSVARIQRATMKQKLVQC